MDLSPTQDCHAVYQSLEKHRFPEACRSSKSGDVSLYHVNTQIPLVRMTADLTRGSSCLGKLSAAGWLSQVPIFAQRFKRYRWQQRLPVVLLNVTHVAMCPVQSATQTHRSLQTNAIRPSERSGKRCGCFGAITHNVQKHVFQGQCWMHLFMASSRRSSSDFVFFTYRGWCEPSLTGSDGGHCLLGGREGGVRRFTAPPRRGRQQCLCVMMQIGLALWGPGSLQGSPSDSTSPDNHLLRRQRVKLVQQKTSSQEACHWSFGDVRLLNCPPVPAWERLMRRRR